MKKERKGNIFKPCAAVIVAVALLRVAVGLSGYFVYPSFYRYFTTEYKYEGISEGFVPQGITSPEGSETVIVCGYMNKKGASRLYVYTADGESVRINLKQEDGSDYTGHAGGLTAAGDYLYISNAHKLFVLDLADVLSAKNGDTLAFKGHIDVPVNASYCSSDGKLLYVGEYHASGYDTDESHTAESADGTYRAYTVAYRLNKNAAFGLEGENPVRTFATRDAVQGFAMIGENLAAISCSRGYLNSHLYIYYVGEAENSESPVILDSENLIKDLTLPRMSEDLELRGNKLLMGFESGAKKFGAGLLPFTVKKTASIWYGDLSKLIDYDYINMKKEEKDGSGITMTVLENAFYEKIKSVISEWSENDIYAISFFVYPNESFSYMGHKNVSIWSVSCNTEADCNKAGPYDEERWNYAFWNQNETPVIAYETPDKYTEMLFDWYANEGITNPGEENENEMYDENGEYIGKGPAGHYELLGIAADVAKRLQEEGFIEKQFGKPLPIIVHGLEYAWYDIEATKKANPDGQAADFLKAMVDLGFCDES